MFKQEFTIGPFSVQLTTDNETVKENISLMYADYEELISPSFIDFPITISTSSLIRRYIKPQADFYIEEFSPFKPLPKDQAYAMFEWGVNYCITTKAHQYFMLHAGVIEKNDKVIIMPAHPGSGKSTLTAALCFNGFRLFSDEIALLSLHDNLVYPCTKPINLKNESIGVIQRYRKDSVFSSIANDTHKGTVALLKPPTESVQRSNEPEKARFIIFPKYKANSSAKLTPVKDKLKVFSLLIEHSFNYHVLGQEAFTQISKLLGEVECYEFVYSDFEEANQIFSSLVG